MDEDAVVHEAQVRVRYAETDQMGVVYHANYLVWFEVGRAELMRALGMEYKDLEREGCGIAVVEAMCKYRAPAKYDDELKVRTRVIGARGPVVRFGYEVVRVADGVTLCTGYTVHVVVGADMKKRTMPEKYAERFRQLHIPSLDD